MFKYFKEMRELKKTQLQYSVLLLGKFYGLVEGFPDIVELAKRAKDLDVNEVQKLIVSELVSYMKANEETPTSTEE